MADKVKNDRKVKMGVIANNNDNKTFDRPETFDRKHLFYSKCAH